MAAQPGLGDGPGHAPDDAGLLILGDDGAVTEGDRPSSTVKSAVGPPVELAISNISGASLDSRRSSMVLAGASGAFLRPRG